MTRSRASKKSIAGYKKLVADGEKHVLIDTREESEWSAGQC